MAFCVKNQFWGSKSVLFALIFNWYYCNINYIDYQYLNNSNPGEKNNKIHKKFAKTIDIHKKFAKE